MNDRPPIVSCRVKCSVRVRVDLDADPRASGSELLPEFRQPSTIQIKAVAAGVVSRVNNSVERGNVVPGTGPKNLARLLPPAAAAELRKGLPKYCRWHPVQRPERQGHPPFTALGRMRRWSPGFTPTSPILAASGSSTLAWVKSERMCGWFVTPNSLIALLSSTCTGSLTFT